MAQLSIEAASALLQRVSQPQATKRDVDQMRHLEARVDGLTEQVQRCINATQRLQSTNAGCTMDQSSDSKTLFDLQVRVALLEQALASTPSLATPTTPSLLGILLAVE